jgi:hypothetical protein
MSIAEWKNCIKQKTTDGLPFPDSKIRCALKLGANISTDAIDSLTFSKITSLNDSDLENNVINRLLTYPHFSFDSTVEMAKRDMALDAQLKKDTAKILIDSRKCREAEERQQVEKQKVRIARDQEIDARLTVQLKEIQNSREEQEKRETEAKKKRFATNQAIDAQTDAQLKEMRRNWEEQDRKKAVDQIRKIAEDQQAKIQLDAQLDKIKHLNDKPATFKPHTIEKTFCGFCAEFHATKILLPCGTIREYPLETWHVTNSMKTDSEGFETQQPQDIDRCILALTQNKGLSTEEAKTQCTTMLSDSAFLHDYIRFPIKSEVRKPSDEDYFIGKTVSDLNVHPEQAKAQYERNRIDNAEYIMHLLESGKLQSMLKKRQPH